MPFPKKTSGLIPQPITQPGVSPDPLNAADQPAGPYAPANFTFPGTNQPSAGMKPPMRKPGKKAAKKKVGGKSKSALFGEV